MSTFFTSDTHFSHRRLIDLYDCRRGFKNEYEMDEAMVTRWNEKIGPDDVVYHIGDFGSKDHHRAALIARRLNGIKRLILGNHDVKLIRNRRFVREFDEIYPAGDRDSADTFAFSIREIVVEGQRIIMSHFPIWEWNQIHRGTWHLHGHVHGKPTGVPGKIMDVSADGNNLTPYAFDDIVRYMNDKPVRRHH